MIVFNLICKICSVEFEGWFESTKEFNNQKRKKIINCPSCNSTSITKSLAAPNLPAKNNSKKPGNVMRSQTNMIQQVQLAGQI